MDDPELLDVWAAEPAGQPLGGLSVEEYFAYDGRPIFDPEHLRQSLIIADPIAGDSMIYLLNPRVVAADGEWEAWRFANWIPGAERFPSFEVLMRAEHVAFSGAGESRTFPGPYSGAYAPNQARGTASPLGRSRAKPPRAKIPELIGQLESPIRAARLAAAKHLLREFCPHDPADEHPEIVEPLSRILRSDLETEVRSAAAGMLGSYGDAAAVGPLIAALDAPVVMGMVLSAIFYLSLYYHDPTIADAMEDLLEMRRDLHVTEHGVNILKELKDKRVAVIGLRLLDDPAVALPHFDDAAARLQAEAFQQSRLRSLGAFAFAKFAAHATDELLKRLTYANPEIRAAATAALREDPHRGPFLARYISPLLSDPDEAVRLQASMTLRSLDPPPPIEISPEELVDVVAQYEAQLKRASRRKSRF